MKKTKIKFYINNILILSFTFLIFTLVNNTLGLGTPKLVSTMEKAFENIESWLIKLATPMAAVAVGSGLFMQKFSFGDEEKIRSGKKLVKTALFSYVFILAIDLVLSAIQSLI
jgi:uncharacterized membrane protein